MRAYSMEKYDDGLFVFTINRPEKRNAINYEVMEGLERALLKAESDDVKVFCIKGEGERAFCSGGDLHLFHRLRTETEAYEMLSKISKTLIKLMLFPKPTVALLNGIAIGGGCEIAAACDFRLGHSQVKAGFVQGTLAIATGWGGGTFLLERLSQANGLKMLFEASIYNADELKELGFLNGIYHQNHVEACRHFCQDILTKEASVLKAYKKIVIDRWLDLGIEEKVAQEVRRCAVLWEKDIHHQLVEKFVNK